MRDVKGCLVCVQLHMANYQHPREEVTAAINKLKEKFPIALITVSDMAFLVDVCTSDNGEDGGDNEFVAEWAGEV